jgi:2-amino-4-hydroxy-6-hydroxymethyldihydropteridine diphosphokinase
LEARETIAYIGIGSNLGDRRANCAAAVAALGEVPGVRVEKTSAWRETAPVGPVPQGDFINGVAQVATTLGPRELFDACLDIERGMGRERRVPKGPRVIDLDLLLYGDVVLDEPGLTVPHPEMARRRFVLEPLGEIAPEARHPVTGRTAAEMLAALDVPAQREAAS